MKKIVSVFCFLLMAVMMQAEITFSVGKIEIKPGDEKTISVVLTNDVDARSAAIDITLPTGLSFVGENGSVEFSDRVSGMMMKSAKIQTSGALRVGLALGETIAAGTGEVFTFKIKADQDASSGVVKMVFSGMSITNTSNEKVTVPDAEFEIKISGSTDPELSTPNIVSTPVKDGIYNLSGQKLDGIRKGIIIIDGKRRKILLLE